MDLWYMLITCATCKSDEKGKVDKMEQNETAKHINRKKEKIHTIDVIIISSTDVTLLGHGFIADSF